MLTAVLLAALVTASGPVASPVDSEELGSVAAPAVRLVHTGAGPTCVPAASEVEEMLKLPVFACYDPENPPSPRIMAFIEQTLYAGGYVNGADGNGERYNLGTRWAIGSTGDPITLSWSFVPDTVTISGGIGEPSSKSNLFAKMDAKFGAGNRATWINYFKDCFKRWSEVTGVNYVYVTTPGQDWDDGSNWGAAGNDTTRGDIRISSHSIDGFGGVLAYCSYPQNGDMVLDSDDMTGSSNFFSASNQYRFLRNVVQHEHGHGLGFAHVCSNNSSQLMEPFISTSYDGVRHDDIRAGQRYYGDINEIDNSSATGVSAGTLNVGSTITLGTIPNPLTGTNPANSSTLSIDANGEVDFHKVTVNQPTLVTVTVLPQGLTYDSSTQAGNGNCNSGNNINSLAFADLAVDALSGASVLATAASAAAGSNEVITQVLLSPAGTFDIKVYESNAPTQSQLYTMTIQGVSAPTITASDAIYSNKVAVSWTNIPGATSYTVYRSPDTNFANAAAIGTPATNSFDDTTASPGVTYYYWVYTTQTGGPNRPLTNNPDAGSTSAPVLPGPFSLVTPADGAIGQSLTPTLSWSASSNATAYTVSISASADLSSPILTQAGVATTSFVVPGGVLSNCNSYYWGVTATNISGSTPSTPGSFSFATVIPADYDGSGFVDFDDFIAFSDDFEAGSDNADFDGSGFVDFDDFNAYVAAFEAGC